MFSVILHQAQVPNAPTPTPDRPKVQMLRVWTGISPGRVPCKVGYDSIKSISSQSNSNSQKDCTVIDSYNFINKNPQVLKFII